MSRLDSETVYLLSKLTKIENAARAVVSAQEKIPTVGSQRGVKALEDAISALDKTLKADTINTKAATRFGRASKAAR